MWCLLVYFDFGFSAGWPDYQFVLAFQVILQHIGTRQTGIFRAAAVFSVGGLRYRCPRPYRLEVKRLWLRGRVVRYGKRQTAQGVTSIPCAVF